MKSKHHMSRSSVDDPVHELRTALIRNNRSDYDSIDAAMQRIAKAHEITGQKLHDLWVAKYDEIPDTWMARRIKRRKAVAKNRKKLEERNEGDTSWGYWISDKGEMIRVDDMGHLLYLSNSVGLEKLNQSLDQKVTRADIRSNPERAYQTAEAAGWIRVANPQRRGTKISVDLNPNHVTRPAVRALLGHLTKFPNNFGVVHDASGSKEVTVNVYQSELRKFLNREHATLLENDMQDPTPYGYWILKDGSKEAVPYEGHMAAASKFGLDNYADMYDDGAIRVVNEHYSTVWKQMVETEITWGMNVPSRKALRTLRDLIREAKPELKIIFECGDAKLNQAASWNHDSFENYTKFLHFINKLIEDSPSVLEENINPDNLYGAWITKNGDFVPVYDRWGHDRAAEKLGYKNTISCVTEAMADGCIRIWYESNSRIQIEWYKPPVAALRTLLQEINKVKDDPSLTTIEIKKHFEESMSLDINQCKLPKSVFYVNNEIQKRLIDYLRAAIKNHRSMLPNLEEQAIGFNDIFFDKLLENIETLVEDDEAIESNSYGAWISKEGQVFAVHNEMDHMRIANLELKVSGTYDALNNGAIRLIFGRPIKKQLSVEIRKPSDAARKKLVSMIEKYGFDQVVLEWHERSEGKGTTRKNKKFDIKNAIRERSIINEISNLVKSQIPKDNLEESYHSIVPKAAYGYWIGPKGKYFAVDSTFGHAAKAREIIGDYAYISTEALKDLRGDDAYKILFGLGYIRVSSNTSTGQCSYFGIEYKPNSSTNVATWEALKNLIKTYKSDTRQTTVVIEDGQGFVLTHTQDMTQAMRAINGMISSMQEPEPTTIEESEHIPKTDYGYWILPDGQFLTVPTYRHYQMADEYIKDLDAKNPHFTEYWDPYNRMFDMGSIRVVFPRFDKETGQTVKSLDLHFNLDAATRPALRAAIKLARMDQVEKIHMDVTSSVAAYFNGNKIDGIRKLNSLLPEAKPYVSVSDSDTSDDAVLMERRVPATEYGYWILPYGDILVVDHMAHISAADEYLADKEIERGQYDQYDRMFEMGAIRVIIEQGSGRRDGNCVVNFQCDPQTTTKQAYDELLNIIRSYKPDAVFKDRWMHENFWSKTMREGIAKIMEIKRSAPRYAWPFDDEDEDDNEQQLLEADIPDTTYGYWILPDGSFQRVNKYSHVNVAAQLLRDSNAEYYHMFEIGTIRIVSEHKPDTLEAEYTRGFATRAALRSLLQLINNRNPKQMFVDERVKFGDTDPREMDSTTDPIKIVRLINQLIPKSPRYVASEQDVWAQPLETNIVPINDDETQILDEADIPDTRYGYWILPNGEFLTVNFQEHWDVAEKYILDNNIQSSNLTAYMVMFDIVGAIRIECEDYYTLNCEMQINTATKVGLRSLRRLITARRPTLVVIETGGRRGDKDCYWRLPMPKALLKVTELIGVVSAKNSSQQSIISAEDSDDNLETVETLEEAEIPHTYYGYWILPSGEFVSVDYQEHIVAASEYFPDTIHPYDQMYDAGAIRVVWDNNSRNNEVSLELDLGSVTKSALRAAKRLIMQAEPGHVVCDAGALVGLSGDSWSGDKRTALTKLEEMIRDARRYVEDPKFSKVPNASTGELLESDIPETDYGYWITPQGTFLTVEYQMHADVAINYLAAQGVISNILNCYDILFEQGFIRILLERYRTGQRVNYQYQEGKPTRQALRGLIKLLRHLQPATVAGDGFPRANEAVLNTDWRKVTASLTELLPSAPKAEEVTNDHALMELRIPETEYGYWIMPDGDLIPVTIFDHDLVAKRITGLKTGGREQLMRNGAIRVVSALTEDAFEFEVFKDSKAALKALAKLLRHVKPERIIGDWGNFTVMGDWKKVSRQIEKYLEEGQGQLKESQQIVESVSFHPSIKEIRDGEVYLLYPEATSTTEERCPYCHNGKIHWSENDVRACEMCKGTGIFHEPVYDFPELSVSNRSAGVIQEMLGLEPDYSGYIDNKDIPLYIRHLIKIINTGEVEKFKIDSNTEQKTIVDRDGDIPTIRRGAKMIDLGLTKEDLVSYATRLLEIFKYAQKMNLHVSWA
jgi:elongation factor P hydroxylase